MNGRMILPYSKWKVIVCMHYENLYPKMASSRTILPISSVKIDLTKNKITPSQNDLPTDKRTFLKKRHQLVI